VASGVGFSYDGYAVMDKRLGSGFLCFVGREGDNAIRISLRKMVAQLFPFLPLSFPVDQLFCHASSHLPVAFPIAQ